MLNPRGGATTGTASSKNPERTNRSRSSGMLRNVDPDRMLMAKLASDRKPDRAGAPVEERSIGNHVGRCGGKYIQVIGGEILCAQRSQGCRVGMRAIPEDIERGRRVGARQRCIDGRVVEGEVGLDKLRRRLRIGTRRG